MSFRGGMGCHLGVSFRGGMGFHLGAAWGVI